MEQLLYRSYAKPDLASVEVFKIIEASARNNPSRDVTGFLIFARDEFLQMIEGPGEALDNLLGDLADDPRHRRIEIIARRSIASRTFPNWRMERLSFDQTGVDAMIKRLSDSGLSRPMLDEVVEFAMVRKAA